jgi:hypothetical protein
MKWLATTLDPVRETELIIKSYDTVFDLDNAVGVQLDVTGDIVGRKRLLSFEPEDGSGPFLDDRLYRVLQKAKISMNHWDGTIPGVLALWENIFPEYRLIIRDNQDMTMDLLVVGMESHLEQELMARGYMAPKPQGVRVNYTFRNQISMQQTDYHAGAVVERVKEYFEEWIPIVTDAVNYDAGVSFERIREVHTA